MNAIFKNKKFMCAAASLASVACLCAALAGCAPQMADSSATDEDTAAQETQMTGEFTFSMEADCTTCHSDEAAGASNAACVLGNENHTTLTCTTCHDDEAGLTTVHDGVQFGDQGPKRLKETEVDAAICLSCHGSYEELAEQTADCTILTDKNGTCVNPHEVVGLNDMHTDSMDCLSCHPAHSDKTVEEEATDTCTSCHHIGVYECYTCHE